MNTCSVLACLFLPFAQSTADSNIHVPTSSICRASDAGHRAHTNHLIYIGPSAPHHVDPPAEMLNGPLVPLTPGIQGYYPSDIHAAYDIPATGGAGAIAVVDAYNYQTSLSDFNTFANQFNLPVETSTNATSSSNKVFQVVYQSGKAPSNNADWGQEAALDIEWSHAMCRNAKIYLVEANSDSISDLFAAVQVAEALPGIRQISMSFGTNEFSGENSYDSMFVKSGITFYAAMGDTAAQTNYPAMSPNVVGVGGTSLVLTTSDRVTEESAWSDGGGGSSPFEPIPSFQSVVSSTVGSTRGGPDIAFCADPNYGCAVYDSTEDDGYVGWLVVGGTSLATPCCAAIANTSGHNYSSTLLELEHIYQGLGRNFRDIVIGSAGSNDAKAGWDFCTGVGVPLRNISL